MHTLLIDTKKDDTNCFDIPNIIGDIVAYH